MKLEVGIIALFGLAVVGSAQAADLPTKAPAYTAAPVLNWTGFYAGVNVGYGWSRATVTALGLSASEDLNGVVGGGQLGYNWQAAGSPLVIGIEADIQGTDQHHDTLIGGATVRDSIPYFGTVRGRLGYASGAWMVYGTGGWAYGEARSEVTFGGATLSASQSRGGWAAGAGVEWMFAQHWSAKVEYLHVDTGNINSTFLGVPFTTRVDDNVVRVGANYHF